jgi:hypothetical protein
MKLISYLESNFNDDKYADYYGGAVAALRALNKNEDIAILTARSNKSAHEGLLKALENAFSKELKKEIKIPRDRVHFVNDDEFSGNLPKNIKNSFEKKAYVILSYLQNGDWDKIKFYDDDNNNLSTVKNWLKTKEESLLAGIKENELLLKKIKNIKLYDIKHFDNKKLIDNNTLKKENKVLHVFDIDDTLLEIPSKIKVMNGNVIVKELTPNELVSYKLKNGEKLNFSNFRNRMEVEKVLDKLLKSKNNILKK